MAEEFDIDNVIPKFQQIDQLSDNDQKKNNRSDQSFELNVKDYDIYEINSNEQYTQRKNGATREDKDFDPNIKNKNNGNFINDSHLISSDSDYEEVAYKAGHTNAVLKKFIESPYDPQHQFTRKRDIKKDITQTFKKMLTSNYNRGYNNSRPQDDINQSNKDLSTKFDLASANARSENEEINYDIESKFKHRTKTLKEILNSKIYKNEEQDKNFLQNRYNEDTEHGQTEKIKKEEIKHLEEFISTKRPNDAFQDLDPLTQKIGITKEKSYQSNSTSEVLQLRILEQEKNSILEENPSLQFQKELESIGDRDLEENPYIKNQWLPYQQKIEYQIYPDSSDLEVPVNEVAEENDETFQQQEQPYITCTQVNYAEALKHVALPELSRRSDIMITSTISNSMFPKDKRKISQKFRSQMTKDQLQEFVAQNNSFKAITHEIKIESKKIRGKDKYYRENYDKCFLKTANFKSKALHKFKQNIKKINTNKRIVKMKTKQQMNTEQIKHEQNKRSVQKRGIPKFDMDMAKRLIDGKFHEDDDVDEENVQNKKLLHLQIFARKEQFFKNQVQTFESEINKIFETSNKDNDTPLHDEIPGELREEFNIPKQLQGYEINLDFVRGDDASKKRNQPTWSGQDVMGDHLNQLKSSGIVDQINYIRVWPNGIYGIYKRLRYYLRIHVKSDGFNNFMIFFVFLNTITLSLDSYGKSAQLARFLDFANTVFTYTFIYEMFSKLLAIGIKKYVDDQMNWLDGGIVIISLVELIATAILSGAGNGSATAFKSVKMFRSFRVLRVVRLLRALKSMKIIIQVVAKSYSSFGYITILMFLFVFIFTLLGRSFFAGQMNYPDGTPRANFDTFAIAFLTSFQILTTENWNQVNSDTMRSEVNKFITCIYYFFWIFFGNFILLNLFLAILLDAFAEEEEEKLSEEEIAAKLEQKKQRIQQKKMRLLKKTVNMAIPKPKPILSQAQIQALKMKENDIQEEIQDLDEDQVIQIAKFLKILKKEKTQQNDDDDDESENKALKEDLWDGVECNQSFFIFSKQNQLRILCLKACKSNPWEMMVQAVIAFSSLKLAIDTYSYSYSPTTALIMAQFDSIFNWIFIVEMCTKLIALGFIMDKGTYCRDSWNQLDGFIVSSSILDMSLSGSNIPALKVLKLLRSLRPLKFINKNVAMKLIVNALIESLGSIANVLVVLFVIYLIFAIIGMNFYSGQLFYCNIGQYTIHSKITCEFAGGQWVTSQQNFDDIIQALLTLYAVSTLEGWPNTLYPCADANGVDQGPQLLANITTTMIFFIIFIVVGSFFMLNFFIGVLFMKFTEAQLAEQAELTRKDLGWMDIQLLILRAEPDYETTNIPRQEWRKVFHQLVTSTPFETFILFIITCNVLQMGVLYETATVEFLAILDQLNYVFLVAFVFEMIAKMVAFGRSYFNDLWNKFDFFIVMTSILDVLLTIIGWDNQIIKIFRVLRIARMLKLAQKAENLQAIIQTIVFSIPSIMNVFLLLLLVYFMFAVLGNFLFSSVTEGSCITDYRNYKNFLSSFIFSIILSTGENWPFVMYDLAITPAMGCIQGTNCGTIVAYPFFIIFTMFLSNVMLNLFVLVIIQQFEKYYLSKENLIMIYKRDQEIFMSIWKKHTIQRYNCIRMKETILPDFMRDLGEIGDIKTSLGLGRDHYDDSDVKKILLRLGIKADNGFIYFNQLLYNCMKRKYGNFPLGRRMQLFEVMTQYQLYLLSQQAQYKSLIATNAQIIAAVIKKENAVNPYLTRMNFIISFKTWIKEMRLYMRKKEKEKLIEEGVNPADLENFDQGNQKTLWVEIETEIFYEETSDEEDTVAQGGQTAINYQKLKRNTLEKFERKVNQKLQDQLTLFKLNKRQQMQGK